MQIRGSVQESRQTALVLGSKKTTQHFFSLPKPNSGNRGYRPTPAICTHYIGVFVTAAPDLQLLVAYSFAEILLELVVLLPGAGRHGVRVELVSQNQKPVESAVLVIEEFPSRIVIYRPRTPVAAAKHSRHIVVDPGGGYPNGTKTEPTVAGRASTTTMADNESALTPVNRRVFLHNGTDPAYVCYPSGDSCHLDRFALLSSANETGQVSEASTIRSSSQFSGQ